MNWLHGNPTTVNPRGPYSSCSASSCVYWGVRPHLLATFTTRAGPPPVRAARVVSSPWRVVTGKSSRSLMPAPALAQRRSFQAAHVIRHVDRVLAQRLERRDLQCAGVGRGQDNARRDPGLIRLQPARRHHAPPVAGPQTGKGELRPTRGEVVAEVALQGEELRRDHGA